MEIQTRTEIILRQFDDLKKAVIDSSSVIYMDKAGFFYLLAENVSLITIPEVLQEINSLDVKIQMLASDELTGTTDEKLVKCALQLNVSVISEDGKILRAAEREGLGYFNSLMMLDFLFYRGKITEYQW